MSVVRLFLCVVLTSRCVCMAPAPEWTQGTCTYVGHPSTPEQENVLVWGCKTFWAACILNDTDDLPWNPWPLCPLWVGSLLDRSISGEIWLCWGLGLGGNSLHRWLRSSTHFSWTSCHCKIKRFINHPLHNNEGEDRGCVELSGG